jgi:hypothetical protein
MSAQLGQRARTAHAAGAMRGSRRTLSVAVAGTLLLAAKAWAAPVLATTSAPAQATTSATILPSFSRDHLGAKSSLTFTIHYSGGLSGVPSPVRRSLLRFPAGLSLELPALDSCAPARLRARGIRGCRLQSKLGDGSALVEVRAGSQTLTENVALSLFLGAPHNLQPTFAILAQGHTPFDERVVLNGSMLSDRPPYGQALSILLPPIRTLTFEPDASIVSFSLVIGSSDGRHGTAADAVIVPSSCPAGGFPFAAEFTYADGSSGSAAATVPCP